MSSFDTQPDVAFPKDMDLQPRNCREIIGKDELQDWIGGQNLSQGLLSIVDLRAKKAFEWDNGCGILYLPACRDELGKLTYEQLLVPEEGKIIQVTEDIGAIITEGSGTFGRNIDTCAGRDLLENMYFRAVAIDTDGSAQIKYEISPDGLMKIYVIKGAATLKTLDGVKIADVTEGNIIWLKENGENYDVINEYMVDATNGRTSGLTGDLGGGCNVMPVGTFPKEALEFPGTLSLFLIVVLMRKLLQIRRSIDETMHGTTEKEPLSARIDRVVEQLSRIIPSVRTSVAEAISTTSNKLVAAVAKQLGEMNLPKSPILAGLSTNHGPATERPVPREASRRSGAKVARKPNGPRKKRR